MSTSRNMVDWWYNKLGLWMRKSKQSRSLHQSLTSKNIELDSFKSQNKLKFDIWYIIYHGHFCIFSLKMTGNGLGQGSLIALKLRICTDLIQSRINMDLSMYIDVMITWWITWLISLVTFKSWNTEFWTYVHNNRK